MKKYIANFNNHTEYVTYINGNDKILPNVSYCEDNNEVHYNPWTDPRVIAKFNVEDETEPVLLYGVDYGIIASDSFSKIEIDGEEISISELEGNDGYYTFDTTGEHTVKYTLPDPEVIENGVFSDCSSLTSINIPNSVTSIGDNAFGSCYSLTSITIPSSVTSIGESVFQYCIGLTSIEIPSSVTSIGNDVFYECSSLTSIDIPSSVTSIGNHVFYECSSLTSITIPNSVTSIGESAFDKCSGLTSITIPNSVTSIGMQAFTGCSGLTSMSVESGNTVYDSRGNCNAIIETATNTLLSGCQNTIIPSSVTSISAYAFTGCSGLTSINIPNSVTSIGEWAFGRCSSLTSIVIPSGVTSIGSYTFYNCTSLESITSQATTAPTIKSNTFWGVKTGGTLYVPSGSTRYNVWMGTGNYYLGKYNWTKVEQ